MEKKKALEERLDAAVRRAEAAIRRMTLRKEFLAAFERNDVEDVKAAIALDPSLVNLTTKEDGLPVLSDAIWFDKAQLFDAVLAVPELDINACGAYFLRVTPLMVACKTARPAYVERLLEKKGINASAGDLYGTKAFAHTWTASAGEGVEGRKTDALECARLLLAFAGYDVSGKDEAGMREVREALDHAPQSFVDSLVDHIKTRARAMTRGGPSVS